MIIKNAEIFSANKLLLSPAGDGVQGFACGDLLLEGQTPDQKSVGRAKPFGDSYFPKPLNGAGSKKNLLSLKAANSHCTGHALLLCCS